MKPSFTHIDSKGKAKMVDVGSKQPTPRTAIARATIRVTKEISAAIQSDELHTKKGPVFQTAILAGIMGAKKTSDLIPLCHPLSLDNCEININLNDNHEIVIECTASIESKTGVEMEALTGVSVAALTIYDMCKAISHELVIAEIKLIKKTGGKSDFERP